MHPFEKPVILTKTGIARTLQLVLAAPGLGYAATGGGQPIVIVADTRGLTGWHAWWGNLYNESHAYFTLMTIVVIPAVAVVFGLLTDLLLSNLGISLRSRHLGEH